MNRNRAHSGYLVMVWMQPMKKKSIPQSLQNTKRHICIDLVLTQTQAELSCYFRHNQSSSCHIVGPLGDPKRSGKDWPEGLSGCGGSNDRRQNAKETNTHNDAMTIPVYREPPMCQRLYILAACGTITIVSIAEMKNLSPFSNNWKTSQSSVPAVHCRWGPSVPFPRCPWSPQSELVTACGPRIRSGCLQPLMSQLLLFGTLSP